MAGVVKLLAAGLIAALAAGCVSGGGSKPATASVDPAPAMGAPPPLKSAADVPGAITLRPGVTLRPDGIIVTRVEQGEYQKRLQTGYSDQEVTALIRNKTMLFTGTGLSNRIEYLAADGRAYLWLINADAAAPTSWTVDANKTICVSYPSHPSNLKRLGKPQCSSIATWDKDVIGRADGDIFGLSSGKVPKTMTGFPMQLEKLRQELGLAAAAPAAAR
jgi:hypothetical protein